MRLTISKYYLPSGKSIFLDVGVEPDILVEENGDNFEINIEFEQLQLLRF